MNKNKLPQKLVTNSPANSANPKRKYIICGYYGFPGSRQTLDSTLKSSNYLVGAHVKCLSALANASRGDILLLRYKRKIVAYGEVLIPLSPLPPNDVNRPHYDQEIRVGKWILFDGNNSIAGISVKEVMKNCLYPQPSRAIVKEVTQRFAQPFIDKINSRQPQP